MAHETIDADAQGIIKKCSQLTIAARALRAACCTNDVTAILAWITSMRLTVDKPAEACNILEDTTDHLGSD